jgi:hypothetical protein
VNERPRQLATHRLLAALLVPLGLYVLLRKLTGSATGALAITEAIPATWLLVVGLARRRLDPIGVISTVTVAIALAVYALTGGDPIALKLRHGAVTGVLGVAALASVALGRPLLLVVAQRRAELDSQRRAEIEAKLAEPQRRRALTILTMLLGLALTVDGVVQIALALTVSTSAFIPDSTAAHALVLGAGVAVIAWYIHHQKEQRRTPSASSRL